MKDWDSCERLLVDVDGTICNNLQRACQFIREEYGKDIHPDEITEWSYRFEDVGIELADVFEYLLRERPKWYLQDLEPVPEAKRALADLSKSGYELTIVTHRPPETHHLTKQWLSEQDFTYDEFVEDVPDNKADVDGDILIDDYHGHVRNAAEANMYSILMDRPYNTVPSHRRATVATSWDEVVEIVPRLDGIYHGEGSLPSNSSRTR